MLPRRGVLGMLAIGSGGLASLVMMGEPLFVKMPKVLGVKLTGTLPDWVSARDVVPGIFGVTTCTGAEA